MYYYSSIFVFTSILENVKSTIYSKDVYNLVMVEKVIAVIDMRAFYSYVECVDRGLDPYKTPLVVADKDRGVNTIILSVTPYLKSLGVPSRLRIKELPKRDDYIYAIPRMERYLERSSFVMSIILDYISQEDLHIYSIDECFLNLGPYLRMYNMSAEQLVSKIKGDIYAQSGLECTAGISSNMFLAKIALDHYAKKSKNGIATLNKDEIEEKLWPITPLTKIWGIGHNLEARLNYFGIYTVKDLALANRDFMRMHFGVIGDDLVDHANGIDNSDIREKYIPKEVSLSQGQVLFRDYNKEEAKLIIKELMDDLLLRLRMENKLTSCVHLYIGYSKTGGFAKQMSLLKPSDNNDIIYDALMEIYNKKIQDEPIRRISISLSKLTSVFGYLQMDLFISPEEEDKKRRLQYTIDAIQNKYGKNALLDSSTIKERHTFIGGHRR